jgi:D-alanyl-D-alanine carboxypeptidase/D-alanyl-D-alanine-endopeptidase (penicillin-binding protein 4)
MANCARLAARRAAPVAVTLAALVAIALAGCGGSVDRSSAASISTKSRRAAAVQVDPRAAGARRATGAKPAPDGDGAGTARSAALAHLQAVLVGEMAPEGDQSGLLVYDMSAHATLFTRSADVGRPPASVEKLYTTIATDTLLGPGATFPTDVLGTGHLGPGGIWHGNLYLRGDGDPTFGDGTFNHIDEDGYGPTAAQLAAQLRSGGIRIVTGEVVGDESRFDGLRGGPLTDYQPDLPDYGGELSALVYDHGATAANLSPAAFAARELVLTMQGAGIRAKADPHAGIAPLDARGLASVSSPPVSVLLRLMDIPSDDLFADLLAKQLGYDFDGRGTLTEGAQQIGHLIASRYGLHPTILDGSGLDKADRSSPAQVVALLRDAWGTPAGEVLASSLPVVGKSGTVQTLGVHSAAQGHCVAKTGTLNYVTNLAGYCHALGGHLLAFAVLIDGPGNWTALEAISRIVGDIAAY